MDQAADHLDQAADHPHIKHRTMTMTMVYAKIADRTVADECFAVSEKVEAHYHRSKHFPANAEGTECSSCAAKCTTECSAAATAHAPSKCSATSSPSANHVRSSHHHRISTHTLQR